MQSNVIGRNFGLQITGMQLQDLSPDEASEVLALYSQVPLMVFHDQELSPQDDQAFGPHFGELPDHGEQRVAPFGRHWHAGDVVVWNNLCSMHCATAYDDDRCIRHVHRLWLKSPVDLATPAGHRARAASADPG